MSNNITGIVQEVNNNGMGKGSNVVVNGQKYGCYDPVKTGIDIVAVGDEVSFDWAQKGQYINIMGRVNKTGNTGVPTPAPVVTAPKAAGGNKGGWGNKGVFPVPALDGQRSIIRQNSVTNAVNLIVGSNEPAPLIEGLDMVDLAEYTIKVAKVFEAYSTGDLDEAEANAAVAALAQPAA